MKHLGLLLLVAALGCEKPPSKLEGAAKGATTSPGVATGGAMSEEAEATLRSIDGRLKALEAAHQPGAHNAGGQGEASIVERTHRLEAGFAKYGEALDFLNKVYAQQKAQQDAQEANEPDPTAVFAVDISGAVAAGQSDGPNSAIITTVAVWDFACPYCQKVSATLHELVKEYSGKVRVVHMNMVVHPDTVQLAHQYGCAAAKQQKFLAWKDAFWEKGFGAYAASGGKDRSTLGEENMLKFSAELGLDIQKLKADGNSDGCKQRVAADQQELQKFRVSGTPAFFINGQFIGGGIPKEAFKQIIDEKLKIAEASGVPGAQYYEKEIMGKGSKQFRSKRDAARGAAGQPEKNPHDNHGHP